MAGGDPSPDEEIITERTIVKLSPYPMLQFFDDNGDPLSGGLLYSYEAGATPAEASEKVTYKDAAGTQNTNPIVLDAAGRAQVWLGEGVYKLVLANAGDSPVPTNPIWTVDYIQEATEYNSVLSTTALRALAPGQSAIVYLRGNITNGDGGQGWFYWNSISSATDDDGITFKPSVNPAQGRWVRFVEGFVDPKWYGATGDGSTDDKDAFVAANTSAGARSIYIRVQAGTYRWGSTLTITAPIMLMPHAVLKWTGFRPNFPCIIEDNDFTQHFDDSIPYNYAPEFYVAGNNQTLQTVRPEWFGGASDGATDNYLPIYKAMQSIDTFGGVVRFSAGEYMYGTTINLMSNITLRGCGADGETSLSFTNDGEHNGFGVAAPILNAAIESMKIRRPTSNEVGAAIYSEINMVNCRFTNLTIAEFANGIFIQDASKLTINDVTLAGAGKTVYINGTGIVLGSDVDGAYKSVSQACIKNVYIYGYATGIRVERSFGSTVDGAYISLMYAGIFTKTPLTATGVTVVFDSTVVGSIPFITENTYDLIEGNLVLINPFVPFDTTLVNYGPYEEVCDTTGGGSVTVVNENGTNVFPISGANYETGIVTRTWNEGATTAKRVCVGDVGSAGDGYSILKVADAIIGTTYNFSSPTWVKFTKSHTEYASGGSMQTTKIFDLPAKCMIHSIFLRHTEAWVGTGITRTSAIVHPTSDILSVSLLQNPLLKNQTIGGDSDGEGYWAYSNFQISSAPDNTHLGYNLTNLSMRKHHEKYTVDSVSEEVVGFAYIPYDNLPYANGAQRSTAVSDYVNKGLFHLAQATGIYLLIGTTGGNISALTAGELEVSFLISKLP